ncbi:MAG: 50S ribosomal protein L37Ae [archaeon]|nr:50S ribosomal protein L37Ae [archaeon]
MERRTVKAGVTGKYGTRYGQKLRKQVKGIEILQRKKVICPFCGKLAIKRKAAGIWKCSACRRSVAGGAWEFATVAATTAKTTINRLKKNLELKKTADEELEEKEEEMEEKETKKQKKEKKEKEGGKRKEDKKEKKEKKGKK